MNQMAFVKKIFDKDADCAQRQIIVDLKKEFGHGLSFKAIRALRLAHKAGKYDAVAPGIFEQLNENLEKKANRKPRKRRGPGRPPKTAKRGPGRPPKVLKRGPGRPPKVVKRGPGRPPKVETLGPGRPPKERGDRRMKTGKRGRRRVDKTLVAFDTIPSHLVLLMRDGQVEDHRFKGKLDARQFIADALGKGITPDKIAYFSRSEFDFSMNVNVKLT